MPSAGGQDQAHYLVPITGAQEGMAPIYQDWLQAPEFSYVFDWPHRLRPNATYIVVLHFAGHMLPLTQFSRSLGLRSSSSLDWLW